MEIINASVEVEEFDGKAMLKKIEKSGRICYKSESKITPDSASKFVQMILSKGHESVIEHCSITARVICDRGVTHELVRHRLASYSQESTRYCNYSGKGLTVIEPSFWDKLDNKSLKKRNVWLAAMRCVEGAYNTLIYMGATPQEARSVLPNSLKTEIVMTMNLREWRHFFKLRTAKAAHPQMRDVAVLLYDEIKKKLPVIFDDIQPYRGN